MNGFCSDFMIFSGQHKHSNTSKPGANVTAENLSLNDAKAALEEVILADQQMAGDESAPRSQSRDSDLTEKQVEQFRDRAQKQRARGKKDLARRHDGVASVVKTVHIKERVIGSAFQRYFAAIENGLSVIDRRAEMFVTQNNVNQIAEKIQEIIESVNSDLVTLEASVKVQLEVAGSASDFVTPGYTGDAASHEVQIRTKTALSALRLFERYDKVLQGVQTLHWNDVVEQKYIEDVELQAKQGFNKLFKFVSQTLRGMRNKAVAAPATRGEAANGAADKAEGAIAEAA